MAKKRRIRWDRVAMVAIPFFLLILLLCKACDGDEKKKPKEESSADTSSSQVVDVPVDKPVEPDEFIVVIDAGHGGKDSGATNKDGSRLEKDDNLRLALATRDALQKYPDVKVLMTREDDTFIPVHDRPVIANEAHADLFVSLHRNTATEGNGVEVWYDKSEDTDLDQILSEFIMETIADVGVSNNRGAKVGSRGSGSADDLDDGYIVNRETDMPSCLVEMGFMSSKEDNDNFDNKLMEYADAIAKAIMDLKKFYKLDQLETLT